MNKQETFTYKREKTKGHYRTVCRNSKGQIVTSKKWSSVRPAHKPEDCPCIYSCCKENRKCCGSGYCDEIQKEGDKLDD